MNSCQSCCGIRRLLICVLAAGWFAGCASPSAVSQSSEPAADQVLAACMKATGARNLLLVEVPAAGNPVANRLAVLALKVSPSMTAVTLARLMSAAQRPMLVVYGADTALTVATMESVLDSDAGDFGADRPPVCVAGLSAVHALVVTKARELGIALVPVPQP